MEAPASSSASCWRAPGGGQRIAWGPLAHEVLFGKSVLLLLAAWSSAH